MLTADTGVLTNPISSAYIEAMLYVIKLYVMFWHK